MTSAPTRLFRVSIATAIVAAAPALAGGPAYIEIPNLKGATAQKGHEKQIEILSWSWGEGRGSGDVKMKGSKINQNAPVVDRDEKITIHSNRTEEAAGDDFKEPGKVDFPNARAAPKTTVSDITILKPMEKGSPRLGSPPPSGTLVLVIPAGTCVSGARYPTMTLVADGKSHVLHDVTVASCGPAAAARGRKAEEAKLDYLKIELKDAIVTKY